MKTSFWSIFCFLYQIFVNFWRQKNPNSKMVHRRKISTTEVRGNKRFFYTQSGVGFWFRPLFGKMIAAPPGWSTFREKIFIWANSVIIHSLKNMFKVPGGICWQFFPVQMRSGLRISWDICDRLYAPKGPFWHKLRGTKISVRLS